MYFLYSTVSGPLDRSKRFTLFALPGRPVHSDTNSASPGSILAMQQLRATTKSLTFPPLSIARYSFIQLSQLGTQMVPPRDGDGNDTHSEKSVMCGNTREDKKSEPSLPWKGAGMKDRAIPGLREDDVTNRTHAERIVCIGYTQDKPPRSPLHPGQATMYKLLSFHVLTRSLCSHYTCV